ncbi:hypothetical protein C8R43DRAFT_907042, partial [Mycena crocata]
LAGSTHSNYMNYTLETVVRLELESSQGLKEGDFIVEFFNRLLEDIVEHKSAQFDDHFICDVISRNLRNIALLKLAWRTGIGMEKKAHRHSDPHTKPEMQILLKVYRDTELHRRRLGRQIDDRDTDDFARGVKKLREGGLEDFKSKTLFNRQVLRTDEPPVAPTPAVDSPDSEDTSNDGDGNKSDSDSDAASLCFRAAASDRDMESTGQLDSILGLVPHFFPQ